jgi:hypothetical protein
MPELFKGGLLHMATDPLAQSGAPQLWADCTLNRWAVVVALILLIIELSEILRIYPHLLRCLSRWKGNADLEHSVSLARTRNTVAFVFGIIFCIIADRCGLVAPTFKLRLPPGWQLAVTTGLIAGATLIRRIAYLCSKFRSSTSEYAMTVRHSIYNYLILLTTLIFLSVLVMVPLHAPDTLARAVLYAECAVFFLLFLIRQGQILRSRCGTLATILYLCALEILPVGILIFACTL